MVIAVSAYSNNKYVYSANIEYSYFGTDISGQNLQALMEKYGIQQTGDSETDLRALYNAMYADAANQTKGSQPSSRTNNGQEAQNNSQATDAGNSTNVPWANLMNQVGLSAIGDLKTDYDAFANKIAAMQSSGGTSPENQATINQLIAEASIVFVQPDSSSQGSSSSAPNPQPHPPSQSVSGADIQAQLNRMLVIG